MTTKTKTFTICRTCKGKGEVGTDPNARDWH